VVIREWLLGTEKLVQVQVAALVQATQVAFDAVL
jgi:hypothetical protein